MNDESRLQWEARWARPAALAAFAAAIALIAQQGLLQAALEDRPGIRALPDYLLSVDERPGLVFGSSLVFAIGALLLAPVFLYLFRATLNREAVVPRWFVYLIYAGPALFALSQLLGSLDRIDLAHEFADGEVLRLAAGEDRAEEFLDDNPNVPVFVVNFAGIIGVAFLFVMLPLRARRVGLLSPFMSILGVVAGALLVLQLAPQVVTVILAFWLVALGALYLGRWPGGRGPAWESGRPEPWPTAAQRRGLAQEPQSERSEPEPDAEPARLAEGDGQADAERPVPRKRKRKRR